MRNQHNSRNIDVSRARRARRRLPRPRAAAHDVQKDMQRPLPAPGRAGPRRARAPAARTICSGTRPMPAHGAPLLRAPSRPGAGAERKKTGLGKKIAVSFVAVLCLMAIGVGALYWYVAHSLAPRESGSLTQNIATPPEYSKDLTNILVLGIDYDDNPEEQALGIQRSKNGNTDMILYVQFNKKKNSVHMLQIPRDAFVGWTFPPAAPGASTPCMLTGRIRENRVQNIAQVLYDQLKLPVDDYVVIDMQMLKAMMTALGDQFALQVYVPVTMEYNGSRLEAGYRWLQGEELEFFLRQRKDSSATPARRHRPPE